MLVIDKPAGLTSHDVVALVRRAIREKRIGHTGTLDPLATGVLPLVIGKATRLASLLSGADKEYEAGIRLGGATDTYDTTGVVANDPDRRRASETAWSPPDGIRSADVESALSRFRGTFEQTPPRFSAKKIDGVASYKRARRNEDASPPPVRVTVSRLELRAYEEGLATVRVTASAGFYVRALAHDLGGALGCGGHLETLRRVRAGRFSLEDAVPLDRVQTSPDEGTARIIPMERAIDLPVVRLTERGAVRAGHGNALGPADLEGLPPAAGGKVGLIAPGGELAAIADLRPGGVLQPTVVLV